MLQGFIDEVQQKKTVYESKQLRYTSRSGEEVLVRDSVNSLLQNLKKYSSLGDLIIQPLPSVVSLAWGGFKVLL